MGLIDKLFGKIPKSGEILTDDEIELRDYESSVYEAESGVTDSTYAEYVIEEPFNFQQIGVAFVGTVTGGVFKIGDKVQVCRGENVIVESTIEEILQFKTPLQKAAEGAFVTIVLNNTDSSIKKMIKPNDILKKI